jgi:cell division protein FtsQ
MKANWKIALKKLARLFAWVCVIGFVLFALAFSHKQAETAFCTKVNVRVYPAEIGFYNRQKILEQLRKKLPEDKKAIGLPLGEIKIDAIESHLNDLDFVESADVFADMHGELNLTVKQRRPILRVLRYDGTQFYVDQYGIKMPLSEHFTCRVPIANGNIFERFEKSDSVYSFVGNQVFKIASYVDKHPFYKALIEQIFVKADNEIILVPKIGKQLIVFGDANEIEIKFKKLLAFYREGLSRIGWSKYKTIDLRFDGQVICKK